MENTITEKSVIKVLNGRVNNLLEVLSYINQENNPFILKELQDDFASQSNNINSEEAFAIKNAIEIRLDLLDGLDIENFKNLLSKIVNSNEHTTQNLDKLREFGYRYLSRLEHGNLSFDGERTLETLIYYCQENNIIPELVASYDNVVTKKREQELVINKEIPTLQMKPIKQVDTQGAIVTIAILEVTLLAALFIAFLLLAKF